MKKVEMWLVLFFCISSVLATTFEVSTDGCGTSKTCRYFPSGCSPSDNTCRIITWRQATVSSSADTPKIVIEMRSSPSVDYFAMGFGQFKIMQDADVYYCTSANTFATAAITTKHLRPSMMPLENGVKQISSSVKDGAIHCEYERTMSVTKISTDGPYNYDISNEMFHILVAEGPTDGADHTVEFHSWKEATADKINFTATFVSPSPTLSVPATSNATSNDTPTTVVDTASANANAQTSSTKATVQTTSSAESSEISVWLGCAIFIVGMPLSNWNA